ncbi:MAG: hypothetical protein ACREHG_02880 [Candidatus Saccharimonadales bacterium]
MKLRSSSTSANPDQRVSSSSLTEIATHPSSFLGDGPPSSILNASSSLLSPDDSASQVIRPARKKRKTGSETAWDSDDQTDEAECDDENKLRECRFKTSDLYSFFLGQTRRQWTAKTYNHFEKAKLVLTENGKVVKVKSNDGKYYAQYEFKCKK